MSFALVFLLAVSASAQTDARAFLRGNLHVHTSASDGDAPAEAVAAWYSEHGYAFLALTDHDLLVSTGAPAGLTLLPGVEITSWSRSEKKPVHVNAVCASTGAAGVRLDAPVAQVLTRTLAAARGAGGLMLVNHPSFGAALSTATLLSAPSFELLEIASAHPLVPAGPAEQIWDALLTAGRRVHGVAVDDAHDFIKEGERRVPGGAWIEVWGTPATEEGLCAALRAGHFYATTGTRLERLRASAAFLEVSVDNFNPATDRVEFIGAKGKILSTLSASPARFAFRAREPYVRARVTQSGGRRAWTQAFFFRVP